MPNRVRVLYTGLRVPPRERWPLGEEWLGVPFIEVVAGDVCRCPSIQRAFLRVPQYTHLIFTSITAVELFCRFLPFFDYDIKDCGHLQLLAVGRGTAAAAQRLGLPLAKCAQQETAEGVVELISSDSHSLSQEAYFFWPHAAGARDVISSYLNRRALRLCECILYDTTVNWAAAQLDLTLFDAIFFTSPSTVDAFWQLFPEQKIPPHLEWRTQGPITAQHLAAPRPLFSPAKIT